MTRQVWPTTRQVWPMTRQVWRKNEAVFLPTASTSQVFQTPSGIEFDPIHFFA
jgi:hypothetical protein